MSSTQTRAAGEHEARTGQEDPDWPDWYAEYMVRDRASDDGALPTAAGTTKDGQ